MAAGDSSPLDLNYVSPPQPKVKLPHSYFPLKLDRRMPKKTSELPSRPEEMTHHSHLTALSMTPNPQSTVSYNFALYNL